MTSTTAGFDPDAVCQHPLDFLFAEWTMEQTPSLTVARFSDSHVQFLQKLHCASSKRVLQFTTAYFMVTVIFSSYPYIGRYTMHCNEPPVSIAKW
jgi:hypothetical protein